MSKWILFAIPLVFLAYQLAFSQPALYAELQPQAANQRISEFQVIDVREEYEWQGELGHLKEAKLIPLGMIDQSKAMLDKSKPILVVCRSGRRSASAAQILAKEGYQVFNLVGGMQRWHALQLPVVLEK